MLTGMEMLLTQWPCKSIILYPRMNETEFGVVRWSTKQYNMLAFGADQGHLG